MNVAQKILAQGRDAAPALLMNNTVVSYGQLRQTVNGVASTLLAEGHAKGARVGIWAENSLFFVSAYLGIIRAGLVAVPMQTELPFETFADMIQDAGINKIFVSARYRTRVLPWAEALGVSVASEESVQGPGRLVSQAPGLEPARDLAALMFTSGSTGKPKGVMVSHRNIACNTADIVSYLGLNADDRAMVVLPFYYCFGTSLLHTLLWAGGTLVLSNDFKLYPEMVLQAMQRHECTGLAGVPSTYQILLRKSRFPEMRFPKLRWFQQAGGKLPNPFIEQIVRSFPQVRYFLMYGQTEATARLSYLPPERLADKLGSIGRGLPSTRLQVLRPDGLPVVPGSQETGEIVASGDNIALGFWNDPQETAKCFRNGNLYTGDIARIDSDGFIYIVDREREIIKSGGHRVSAKEVEDVIAELPQVVEVAVLGVPHDLLGEAIAAFIVATSESTLSKEDVLAHCRARLPGFKRPVQVRFLKRMPHSGSGKVLKPSLRQLQRAQVPQFNSKSDSADETTRLGRTMVEHLGIRDD